MRQEGISFVKYSWLEEGGVGGVIYCSLGNIIKLIRTHGPKYIQITSQNIRTIYSHISICIHISLRLPPLPFHFSTNSPTNPPCHSPLLPSPPPCVYPTNTTGKRAYRGQSVFIHEAVLNLGLGCVVEKKKWQAVA